MKAIETACNQIITVLKDNPQREFTTSEMSKATNLEPAFLLAIAPYCAPYARRGVERPGYGKQKDRMIRPFIWSYVEEETEKRD